MTRRLNRLCLAIALTLLCAGASSCRITPSMSMGVGFDYYGGGFRAPPYANVGFHGHP